MYPTLVSLGPIVISSYGVLMVIAFFAGAFVVWKKGREEHFEEEELFDATLVTTFWGLIGARLWYVAWHFSDFGVNIGRILAVTKFPGLSFLGALPLGILALWLFARKKKWPFFEIADVFAMGVTLAQIFGFVGAFVNGSGYGTRTNLPWAISFPGVEGARHPVQVYGAVMLGVLLVGLNKFFGEYRTYAWYKGEKSEAAAGLTGFSYLIGLGALGLVLALLRPGDLYWLGLSVEGWVSGALVVVGGVGVYGRSGRSLKGDLGGVLTKIRKIKVTKVAQVEGGKISKRGRKKRERRITAGMDVK